jgi:hypothetical protein
MPSASHVLIVNGRKVQQPVFVVGAPHSGTSVIARALKRSEGFHLTIGQGSVLRVVYAFARRPSMHHGRDRAAATVIRDAFAQGWQISSHSCLECIAQCREATRSGTAPCITERGLARYGDATPDLVYCAEALTEAFPDAQIVQVIRDGRDVVASMLGDPGVLSWFKPSFANVESEFPNPFFGVESEDDRAGWTALSPAAKCALRWRGAVRLAARLHKNLPADQLKTIRYEDLLSSPTAIASALSAFTEAPVSAKDVREHPAPGGGWRRTLTLDQIAQVEKIAGDELRRVGYAT